MQTENFSPNTAALLAEIDLLQSFLETYHPIFMGQRVPELNRRKDAPVNVDLLKHKRPSDPEVAALRLLIAQSQTSTLMATAGGVREGASTTASDLRLSTAAAAAVAADAQKLLYEFKHDLLIPHTGAALVTSDTPPTVPAQAALAWTHSAAARAAAARSAAAAAAAAATAAAAAAGTGSSGGADPLSCDRLRILCTEQQRKADALLANVAAARHRSGAAAARLASVMQEMLDLNTEREWLTKLSSRPARQARTAAPPPPPPPPPAEVRQYYTLVLEERRLRAAVASAQRKNEVLTLSLSGARARARTATSGVSGGTQIIMQKY